MNRRWILPVLGLVVALSVVGLFTTGLLGARLGERAPAPTAPPVGSAAVTYSQSTEPAADTPRPPAAALPSPAAPTTSSDSGRVASPPASVAPATYPRPTEPAADTPRPSASTSPSPGARATAPDASRVVRAETPKASVSLTPSPGAMTIYRVTNPNPVDLEVEHVITAADGFRHTFKSRVPKESTATYHLRDIAAVPSPFQGSLTLTADRPFTAEVVGYDYPGGASAPGG